MTPVLIRWLGGNREGGEELNKMGKKLGLEEGRFDGSFDHLPRSTQICTSEIAVWWSKTYPTKVTNVSLPRRDPQNGLSCRCIAHSGGTASSEVEKSLGLGPDFKKSDQVLKAFSWALTSALSPLFLYVQLRLLDLPGPGYGNFHLLS